MVKVGGEVDSFCTKCQMVLAHTVHAVMGGAPVKVECNTCHGVHRYKGARGASEPRSPGGSRTARPARERPAVAGFDELLASRRSPPRPYSPKQTFAVDDLVDHAIFGLGFVSAVRDAGKVEITFRSDVKILIHGRG